MGCSMVNNITRRAFLKLASMCGATVAGLVRLPRVVGANGQGHCDDCETIATCKIIVFNNGNIFTYSNDYGETFTAVPSFWDMPEDARKAWQLDKALDRQSGHETYIMRSYCGKPTTW